MLSDLPLRLDIRSQRNNYTCRFMRRRHGKFALVYTLVDLIISMAKARGMDADKDFALTGLRSGNIVAKLVIVVVLVT
jgi:hypothetical protein